MAKKALICGVSGQDGAYLAHFLLKKGYEVVGTSRDAQISTFGNLQKLGLLDHIRLESLHTATRRNAPCYCGSGKKYKHCCLDATLEKLYG